MPPPDTSSASNIYSEGSHSVDSMGAFVLEKDFFQIDLSLYVVSRYSRTVVSTDLCIDSVAD